MNNNQQENGFVDPSTGEPVESVIIQEADEHRGTRPTEDDMKAKVRAKEFVDKAIRRWGVMADATKYQRQRSMEALEFNAGRHWDDEMRKEREDKERVVLEINRTPQYLNQVSNTQRQTRPQILIKPRGNGADEANAQVKQGLIRAIERRGEAEDIRDDCFQGMLEKGFSFRRINVEFESQKSWRRVIKPGRFYSDFSVYWDPSATHPLLTDAEDWIITDDISGEEYDRLYGREDGSLRPSLEAMVSTEDWKREWISNDSIRIAEYFYKKHDHLKLYCLAHDPEGDGIWEDEVQEAPDGHLVGVLYIDDEPIWREEFRTKIMWAKIDANRILEGNEDLTDGREWIKPRNGVSLKYIPIVPVFGQKRVVDKKIVYDGMVQDAIAPCLASDYWLSAITEMVALGPKSPWVVVYDSIAEYREMWDMANIENYAALYYDKYDAEGNEMPAPFRNFGEPPIQAMTFILNYADEDLKRVMGIYQRSLGASGPEHSGVAIQSVQREADTANYHYIDKHKQSIVLETLMYLNLLPIVYSTKQAVEVIRPDGTTETVTINNMYGQGAKEYNQHVGDYDVEVEVGYASATKREAAAQGIMEYLKIDGEAAPLVGYLLARNMDFPDKNELEQILKSRAAKMGADIPEGDSDQQIPQQFKIQYQQLSQKLEQVMGAFQQLQQQISNDQVKHQQEMQVKAMELASQERQTQMKIDSEIAKAELANLSANKQMVTQAMLDAALEKVRQDVAATSKPGPIEYDLGENGQLTPTGDDNVRTDNAMAGSVG